MRFFFALLSTLALGACSPSLAVPPDAGDLLVRGEGDGPVLVLLHGYGGRPEDFLGLAERTDLPAGCRVVLPRAPLPMLPSRLSGSKHPPYGRDGGFMWWPFDRPFHDPRAMTIAAMTDARERVAGVLDLVQDHYGVASERIVLGGFSQGAMLALDVALEDPRPLAGLVLLSGSYVDRERWRTRFAARRGLRVYQSHGTRDDVLHFEPAEALASEMRVAGIDVRFTAFDGGHEISLRVSEEAAAFAREVTTR